MKSARTFIALALAVAGITGAQAQPVVDMNARLASAGNLVSSMNPVSFSIHGGTASFRNLVITDNGAGYASNLSVSTHLISGGLADMEVIADTCTGATLAPNGTCTLRIVVDGTCPKAETTKWNLLITSANAPTLTIPVTVGSVAGICQ